MDKTINISLESLKQAYYHVIDYFWALTADRKVAHLAIVTGVVLVLVAVIIW